MPTLPPRVSFWTAAAVVALALWASGAPTILYPLYADAWHLTTAATTLVFAVYPIALVPTLLLFGDLSDHIGRRAVILLGIGALALGSLAFGLAPGLPVVLVGRALMGVGVGLALSPATAALIEFGGADRAHRASTTTTAGSAVGLALATLVGGALVQHAPAPLHLTFWVLLAVTLAVGVVGWFLPRHTRDEARGRWRPRAPFVPRGLRVVFTAGALAISTAYVVGTIFLALGADVARDLVRSDDALVNGAIISISAITIGTVAVLGRRIPPRIALAVGPIGLVLGLAALVGAGLAHALPLFLAASVLVGGGYALMFSGGLGLIAAVAPTHHRGAIISAAYTIGYVAQAASAIGLGQIASSAGLQPALEIGSAALVALAIVPIVLASLPRARYGVAA